MRLPKLYPPVERTAIVEPSSAVDVVNGRNDDITRIKQDLLHGANYNDPAAFEYRSYKQVMTSRLGSFARMASGRV